MDSGQEHQQPDKQQMLQQQQLLLQKQLQQQQLFKQQQLQKQQINQKQSQLPNQHQQEQISQQQQLLQLQYPQQQQDLIQSQSQPQIQQQKQILLQQEHLKQQKLLLQRQQKQEQALLELLQLQEDNDDKDEPLEDRLMAQQQRPKIIQQQQQLHIQQQQRQQQEQQQQLLLLQQKNVSLQQQSQFVQQPQQQSLLVQQPQQQQSLLVQQPKQQQSLLVQQQQQQQPQYVQHTQQQTQNVQYTQQQSQNVVQQPHDVQQPRIMKQPQILQQSQIVKKSQFIQQPQALQHPHNTQQPQNQYTTVSIQQQPKSQPPRTQQQLQQQLQQLLMKNKNYPQRIVVMGNASQQQQQQQRSVAANTTGQQMQCVVVAAGNGQKQQQQQVQRVVVTGTGQQQQMQRVVVSSGQQQSQQVQRVVVSAASQQQQQLQHVVSAANQQQQNIQQIQHVIVPSTNKQQAQQIQNVVASGSIQQQTKPLPRVISAIASGQQQVQHVITATANGQQQSQHVITAGTASQQEQSLQIQRVITTATGGQQQSQQMQRVVVAASGQQQASQIQRVVVTSASSQQQQHILQQLQPTTQRIVIGQIKSPHQTQQIQSSSQCGVVIGQLQQQGIPIPIIPRNQQQRVIISGQQQLLKLPPQQQVSQQILLQKQLAQQLLQSKPQHQNELVQTLQQQQPTQQQRVIIGQQQQKQNNAVISEKSLLQQLHLQPPQIQQQLNKQIQKPHQQLQHQDKLQIQQEQKQQLENSRRSGIIVGQLQKNEQPDQGQIQIQLRQQQRLQRKKLQEHLLQQQRQQQQKQQQMIKDQQQQNEQQKIIKQQQLQQKHHQQQLRDQVLLQQHLKYQKNLKQQQLLLKKQVSSDNRLSVVVGDPHEKEQKGPNKLTILEPLQCVEKTATKVDLSRNGNNCCVDKDKIIDDEQEISHSSSSSSSSSLSSSDEDEDDDDDLELEQQQLLRDAENLVRQRYNELSMALGPEYQVHYEILLRNWLGGQLLQDEFDLEIQKVLYMSWKLAITDDKDNDKNCNTLNTNINSTTNTTLIIDNSQNVNFNSTSKMDGLKTEVVTSQNTVDVTSISKTKSMSKYSLKKLLDSPFKNKVVEDKEVMDRNIKTKDSNVVMTEMVLLHNALVTSLMAWIPLNSQQLERQAFQARGVDDTGCPLGLFTYADVPQARGSSDHWFSDETGSLARWYWPNVLPCNLLQLNNIPNKQSCQFIRNQERKNMANAEAAAVLLRPPSRFLLPLLLRMAANVEIAKQENYPPQKRLKLDMNLAKRLRCQRLKEQERLAMVVRIRDGHGKLLQELKVRRQELGNQEHQLMKRSNLLEKRISQQRRRVLAQFKGRQLELRDRIRKHYNKNQPENNFKIQSVKDATIVDYEMNDGDVINDDHFLLNQHQDRILLLEDNMKMQSLQMNTSPNISDKSINEGQRLQSAASITRLLRDRQLFQANRRMLQAVRQECLEVFKHIERVRELRHKHCPCGVTHDQPCRYRKQIRHLRKQLRIQKLETIKTNSELDEKVIEKDQPDDSEEQLSTIETGIKQVETKVKKTESKKKMTKKEKKRRALERRNLRAEKLKVDTSKVDTSKVTVYKKPKADIVLKNASTLASSKIISLPTTSKSSKDPSITTTIVNAEKSIISDDDIIFETTSVISNKPFTKDISVTAKNMGNTRENCDFVQNEKSSARLGVLGRARIHRLPPPKDRRSAIEVAAAAARAAEAALAASRRTRRRHYEAAAVSAAAAKAVVNIATGLATTDEDEDDRRASELMPPPPPLPLLSLPPRIGPKKPSIGARYLQQQQLLLDRHRQLEHMRQEEKERRHRADDDHRCIEQSTCDGGDFNLSTTNDNGTDKDKDDAKNSKSSSFRENLEKRQQSNYYFYYGGSDYSSSDDEITGSSYVDPQFPPLLHDLRIDQFPGPANSVPAAAVLPLGVRTRPKPSQSSYSKHQDNPKSTMDHQRHQKEYQLHSHSNFDTEQKRDEKRLNDMLERCVSLPQLSFPPATISKELDTNKIDNVGSETESERSKLFYKANVQDRQRNISTEKNLITKNIPTLPNENQQSGMELTSDVEFISETKLDPIKTVNKQKKYSKIKSLSKQQQMSNINRKPKQFCNNKLSIPKGKTEDKSDKTTANMDELRLEQQNVFSMDLNKNSPALENIENREHLEIKNISNNQKRFISLSKLDELSNINKDLNTNAETLLADKFLHLLSDIKKQKNESNQIQRLILEYQELVAPFSHTGRKKETLQLPASTSKNTTENSLPPVEFNLGQQKQQIVLESNNQLCRKTMSRMRELLVKIRQQCEVMYKSVPIPKNDYSLDELDTDKMKFQNNEITVIDDLQYWRDLWPTYDLTENDYNITDDEQPFNSTCEFIDEYNSDFAPCPRFVRPPQQQIRRLGRYGRERFQRAQLDSNLRKQQKIQSTFSDLQNIVDEQLNKCTGLKHIKQLEHKKKLLEQHLQKIIGQKYEQSNNYYRKKQFIERGQLQKRIYDGRRKSVRNHQTLCQWTVGKFLTLPIHYYDENLPLREQLLNKIVKEGNVRRIREIDQKKRCPSSIALAVTKLKPKPDTSKPKCITDPRKCMNKGSSRWWIKVGWQRRISPLVFDDVNVLNQNYIPVLMMPIGNKIQKTKPQNGIVPPMIILEDQPITPKWSTFAGINELKNVLTPYLTNLMTESESKWLEQLQSNISEVSREVNLYWNDMTRKQREQVELLMKHRKHQEHLKQGMIHRKQEQIKDHLRIQKSSSVLQQPSLQSIQIPQKNILSAAEPVRKLRRMPLVLIQDRFITRKIQTIKVLDNSQRNVSKVWGQMEVNRRVFQSRWKEKLRQLYIMGWTNKTFCRELYDRFVKLQNSDNNKKTPEIFSIIEWLQRESLQLPERRLLQQRMQLLKPSNLRQLELQRSKILSQQDQYLKSGFLRKSNEQHSSTIALKLKNKTVITGNQQNSSITNDVGYSILEKSKELEIEQRTLGVQKQQLQLPSSQKLVVEKKLSTSMNIRKLGSNWTKLIENRIKKRLPISKERQKCQQQNRLIKIQPQIAKISQPQKCTVINTNRSIVLKDNQGIYDSENNSTMEILRELTVLLNKQKIVLQQQLNRYNNRCTDIWDKHQEQSVRSQIFESSSQQFVSNISPFLQSPTLKQHFIMHSQTSTSEQPSPIPVILTPQPPLILKKLPFTKEQLKLTVKLIPMQIPTSRERSPNTSVILSPQEPSTSKEKDPSTPQVILTPQQPSTSKEYLSTPLKEPSTLMNQQFALLVVFEPVQPPTLKEHTHNYTPIVTLALQQPLISEKQSLTSPLITVAKEPLIQENQLQSIDVQLKRQSLGLSNLFLYLQQQQYKSENRQLLLEQKIDQVIRKLKPLMELWKLSVQFPKDWLCAQLDDIEHTRIEILSQQQRSKLKHFSQLSDVGKNSTILSSWQQLKRVREYLQWRHLKVRELVKEVSKVMDKEDLQLSNSSISRTIKQSLIYKALLKIKIPSEVPNDQEVFRFSTKFNIPHSACFGIPTYNFKFTPHTPDGNKQEPHFIRIEPKQISSSSNSIPKSDQLLTPKQNHSNADTFMSPHDLLTFSRQSLLSWVYLLNPQQLLNLKQKLLHITQNSIPECENINIITILDSDEEIENIEIDPKADIKDLYSDPNLESSSFVNSRHHTLIHHDNEISDLKVLYKNNEVESQKTKENDQIICKINKDGTKEKLSKESFINKTSTIMVEHDTEAPFVHTTIVHRPTQIAVIVSKPSETKLVDRPTHAMTAVDMQTEVENIDKNMIRVAVVKCSSMDENDEPIEVVPCNNDSIEIIATLNSAEAVDANDIKTAVIDRLIKTAVETITEKSPQAINLESMKPTSNISIKKRKLDKLRRLRQRNNFHMQNKYNMKNEGNKVNYPTIPIYKKTVLRHRQLKQSVTVDKRGSPIPMFRNHEFQNGTTEQIIHNRFVTTIMAMEAAHSIASYVPPDRPWIPSVFTTVKRHDFLDNSTNKEHTTNDNKISVSTNTPVEVTSIMKMLEKTVEAPIHSNCHEVHLWSGCARTAGPSLVTIARDIKSRIASMETNSLAMMEDKIKVNTSPPLSVKRTRTIGTKSTPVITKSTTKSAKQPLRRSMSATVTTTLATDDNKKKSTKKSLSLKVTSTSTNTTSSVAVAPIINSSPSSIQSKSVDLKCSIVEKLHSVTRANKRPASVAFSSALPHSNKIKTKSIVFPKTTSLNKMATKTLDARDLVASSDITISPPSLAVLSGSKKGHSRQVKRSSSMAALLSPTAVTTNTMEASSSSLVEKSNKRSKSAIFTSSIKTPSVSDEKLKSVEPYKSKPKTTEVTKLLYSLKSGLPKEEPISTEPTEVKQDVSDKSKKPASAEIESMPCRTKIPLIRTFNNTEKNMVENIEDKASDMYDMITTTITEEELLTTTVTRTRYPTVPPPMEVTADACTLVASACEQFVRAMIMERLSKAGRGAGTLELRRRALFESAIAADEDIRPTPEYSRTPMTTSFPSTTIEASVARPKVFKNEPEEQISIIIDNTSKKSSVLTVKTVVDTQTTTTTTTTTTKSINKQSPSNTVSTVKTKPSLIVSADNFPLAKKRQSLIQKSIKNSLIPKTIIPQQSLSESSARTRPAKKTVTKCFVLDEKQPKTTTVQIPSVCESSTALSPTSTDKHLSVKLPFALASTSKLPTAIRSITKQPTTVPLASKQLSKLPHVTNRNSSTTESLKKVEKERKPQTQKIIMTSDKSPSVVTNTSSVVVNKTRPITIPAQNTVTVPEIIAKSVSARGYFVERGRPLLQPVFHRRRPFGTLVATSTMAAAESAVANNAALTFLDQESLDCKEANENKEKDQGNFDCYFGDPTLLPPVSRLNAFVVDYESDAHTKIQSVCDEEETLLTRQQQRMIDDINRQQDNREQLIQGMKLQAQERRNQEPLTEEEYYQKFLHLQYGSTDKSPIKTLSDNRRHRREYPNL